MARKIDVSEGARIEFHHDDRPATGYVIRSEGGMKYGTVDFIMVTVMTQIDIQKGARLTFPGSSVSRGLAKPSKREGGYQVTLQVPYGIVDLSTLTGRESPSN